MALQQGQQRTVSWSKEVDEHVIYDDENLDGDYKNYDYNDSTNNNDEGDDYYDQYFGDNGTPSDANVDNQETKTNSRCSDYRNRKNNNVIHQSSYNDDTVGKPQCPNCGSQAIEQHDASGSSICTECGVVVEENMIVSSVDFVEGAGGSSSMVGHFVSATSSKAYTGGGGGAVSGGARRRGMGGGRYGYSRESREQTLQNARRRIQDVASRLRLGTQTIDAAHRLYGIALERNFVLGRKASHVTAACLYIACRQQKSQHMLIDFSDALQVNVYALGTTFLKFRRILGLKLELIDPALYIYRFAAHLDLDDSANAVAMTALRLVARMKRDWIQTGRRPAGICAAALLIASRAHGFQKHHHDVTKILRVCGMTVNTRVREFEHTASALLTLDQFHDDKYDFHQEADPPIFSRNKIMEARAKAIRDGNVELLESGLLDDPIRFTRNKGKWRDPQHLQKITNKYNAVYKALERGLLLGPATATNSTTDSVEKLQLENGLADIDKERTENSKSLSYEEDTNGQDRGIEAGASANNNGQLVVHKAAPFLEAWKQAYPTSKKSLVLADHVTAEEQLPSTTETEGKISLAEWKLCKPESLDKEIESMFRTDEEEKQKEAIFNKINAEYLELQKQKGEMNDIDRPDDNKDDYQQGTADLTTKPSSNKRGKYKRKIDASEGSTTEEQLLAAVSSRKVSRKINYDALSSIFDDDGSFSTDVATTVTEQNEDDVYAAAQSGTIPDELDNEDHPDDDDHYGGMFEL